MSAETKNTPVTENDEQYSLSDDRRVKVLSPGAMVMKRFSATGSPSRAL